MARLPGMGRALGREVRSSSHRPGRRSPDVEGYLAEARIAAGLDHPSIGPSSTRDGRRTAGATPSRSGPRLRLAFRMRAGGFRPRKRAGSPWLWPISVTAVPRMVDRDVKPANILLDAEERPYVADFGFSLFRPPRPQSRICCNLPYQSRPQLRGDAGLHEPRAGPRRGPPRRRPLGPFQFGCGALRDAHRAQAVRVGFAQELLRKILWAEPVPPRQHDPSIADEIQRICLKALSKRAAARYASAAGLADDLRQFLGGDHRPPSGGGRCHGGSRRRREGPGDRPAPRIVPKGLRSFDANDSEFFLPLLPGPRDRNGLPESIRLWKARIESTDPDEAFAVGVIYGPSGCGKSSLVKAGLLPRLSEPALQSMSTSPRGRPKSGCGRNCFAAFPLCRPMQGWRMPGRDPRRARAGSRRKGAAGPGPVRAMAARPADATAVAGPVAAAVRRRPPPVPAPGAATISGWP